MKQNAWGALERVIFRGRAFGKRSLNGIHFEGDQTWCKSMVILRDFPENSALGWKFIMKPVGNKHMTETLGEFFAGEKTFENLIWNESDPNLGF